MGSINNKEKNRGYCLMLSTEDGKEQKCIYESSLIEEIDCFTSYFNGFDDMVKHINKKSSENEEYYFAYIQRNGDKYKKYVVLYRGNFFDYDKVIGEYKNYLLGHYNYFKNISPVRSVNLVREDYDSDEEYVKRCCHAYFSKRNYRDIRGAYVELRDLGLAKKVIVPDTDFNDDVSRNQYTYRENEEFEKMLNSENGPDWDEIYSQFDLEDITRTMKKGSGSGRGHR